MSEQDVIKGGITALTLLLVGGAGSAYMLLHLDREAQRLLDGDKAWYPGKKRGEDAYELKKIKRNIRVFYSILLAISIAGIVFFSIRLAKGVEKGSSPLLAIDRRIGIK